MRPLPFPYDLPDDVRPGALDLLGAFPSEGEGLALGLRFARAFADAAAAERGGVSRMAADAATFAWTSVAAHRLRDGDMSPWFGMASRSLADLAAAGAALKAALPDATEETDEEALRRERSEAAAEMEEDRIQRLEEEGAYGRTHPYVPECEAWIYVRFGAMPEGGRSRFGLAGEDTEDGPDEWRREMGNMTHEAGICVLRATRHLGVPDAYVLMPPDFGQALYGASRGFEGYLLDVLPRPEEGERMTVLRVDGSPLVAKARDRTLRLELGSDGEYMIDPAKPMAVHELALADVWVSERARMDDFLRERRGYDREEPAAAPCP